MLCKGCNIESTLVKISPAKSLFVNVTLSEGSMPFNVTVKTQKEKNATSGDVASRTISFTRSKVFFSVDVTQSHRYVIMRLNGDECRRRLYQVKMYYYFVPQQTRLLTVFPASSAPSELKKILFIDGICAPNASYLKKPTMKIYSNGTFELQGSCECNPGFELNGTSCLGRFPASAFFY